MIATSQERRLRVGRRPPLRRRAALEGTPADVAKAIGSAREGEIVVADHSAIGAYLHDLRAHPLMTREEEHDTAVRFSKSGDPELAARLVTANLRLVVKIAQEHRRHHDNLLDLIQEVSSAIVCRFNLHKVGS